MMAFQATKRRQQLASVLLPVLFVVGFLPGCGANPEQNKDSQFPGASESNPALECKEVQHRLCESCGAGDYVCIWGDDEEGLDMLSEFLWKDFNETCLTVLFALDGDASPPGDFCMGKPREAEPWCDMLQTKVCDYCGRSDASCSNEGFYALIHKFGDPFSSSVDSTCATAYSSWENDPQYLGYSICADAVASSPESNEADREEYANATSVDECMASLPEAQWYPQYAEPFCRCVFEEGDGSDSDFWACRGQVDSCIGNLTDEGMDPSYVEMFCWCVYADGNDNDFDDCQKNVSAEFDSWGRAEKRDASNTAPVHSNTYVCNSTVVLDEKLFFSYRSTNVIQMHSFGGAFRFSYDSGNEVDRFIVRAGLNEVIFDTGCIHPLQGYKELQFSSETANTVWVDVEQCPNTSGKRWASFEVTCP